MGKTPMTQDLVDKLLDKLGTDDQFRTLFGTDPTSAMKQIGAPANFDCGICANVRPLASKQEYQSSANALRTAWLGKGVHDVFSL
jgi:putative modified peptide